MPALRGALREGRLSVGLPRALMPVRLRVRGARAHVHGLHAEGVRGRDRRRHAARGGAEARRLRRGARDAGGRCRCATRRSTRATSTARGELGCVNPEFNELPAAIADVPRDRPPLGLGSGTAPSATTPSTGPSAASANASRHELASRSRRTRAARPATTTPSSVCWKPIAAPTAAGARRLRRGREREPVPRHRRSAGDDERRDEQRERRVDERGDDRRSRLRAATPIEPHRPQPRAHAVGPAARERCARAIPSTLIAGEERRRPSAPRRRDARAGTGR